VSRMLSGRGYTAGQVRNATDAESTSTAVSYGRGTDSDAANVVRLLNIDTQPQADPTLAPGHIRVTLGADYQPPKALSLSLAPGAARSANPTATADAADAPPDAGAPIAAGGIPCVD
jgi:LytR cell envelope-related transcriptional attenuator